MKVCRNGHSVRGDGNFCPACGSEALLLCVNGHPQPNGTHFCMSCGSSMATFAPVPPPATSGPTKPSTLKSTVRKNPDTPAAPSPAPPELAPVPMPEMVLPKTETPIERGPAIRVPAKASPDLELPGPELESAWSAVAPVVPISVPPVVKRVCPECGEVGGAPGLPCGRCGEAAPREESTSKAWVVGSSSEELARPGRRILSTAIDAVFEVLPSGAVLAGAWLVADLTLWIWLLTSVPFFFLLGLQLRWLGTRRQTIAMRYFRLECVSTSVGEAIGFWRALGRFTMRALDGLTLGYGFLRAIWNREHQTLSDSLARVVVVHHP